MDIAPGAPVPIIELKQAEPPPFELASQPSAPAQAEEAPASEPAQPIPLSHRAPVLPSCRLLSHREEEPTDAVPIAYREYAFAIGSITSEAATRELLLSLWEQVRDNLSRRPPGKYVQIALFEGSEQVPGVPPAAILSWKDWRGDPTIQIELSNGKAHAYAAEANTTVPPEVAVAGNGATDAPVESPRPEQPRLDISMPPSSGPIISSMEPSPEEAAAIAELAASVPPSVVPPTSRQPAARRKVPSYFPGARESERPPAERKRRRPEEDLIGELFEHMHALHFMPDVVTGAEYVLSTVWNFLTCEAALIHVFDINTAEFVVVRAAGPNPDSVLLSRTPDREPLFREALRRTRTLAVEGAGDDERFSSDRYSKLGVKPARALCGPVQVGGRYLGIIEIVNAITDAPFFEAEINALDYICDQFAEFVAERPVVLEADVVLRS